MTQPVRPTLPRRTVHLDFHTGPRVPDVGASFDAAAFARTYADARVESVTVFAKCHHGHLYHGTDRPERHPGLPAGLDLLDRQVEALHRVGIKAPIYLSVQVDEFAADRHPEWIAGDAEGTPVKFSTGRFEPGWQILDMNSPYQDYFADQLDDVLRHFGSVDGIFLDMCWDQPSTSRSAVDAMRAEGLDPADATDRDRHARAVAHRYMERFRGMVLPHLAQDAAMSVWFNSRPKTALTEEARFVDHVEIEALPTGGWGYNYLPYVARFVRPLGKPVLAHTGRFHKSWGDNGGLKPLAALKYECCQMLAYGLTAGVGDLLHPSGRPDPETYRLVKDVYLHLERCEPFTAGGRPVVELAVLMDPGLGDAPGPVGVGLVRALQQLRLQFDVVAPTADLTGYRAVVVPESTTIDAELAAWLSAFVAAGGGLLVSGDAAIGADGKAVLPELAVESHPGEPLRDTFLRPAGDPHAFAHALYEPSLRLTARTDLGAEAVYDVVEPYFVRSWDAFSGHDYTPASGRPPRYAAAVANGRVAVTAAPVFTAVGRHAAEAHLRVLRELFARVLPRPLLRTGGPAHLETSVVDTGEHRVVHVLSFLASRQGEGTSPITLRPEGLDLVQDPFPLIALPLDVESETAPVSVTLEPEGTALEFRYTAGRVTTEVTVPDGHAMVVLHY